MKKIKDIHKFFLGIFVGIVLVIGISVYAVTAVIESSEVTYNNQTSKGGSTNVQGSIDELYQRYKDLTGETSSKYTEGILNGADPVLGSGMIPVTIDDDGKVKYANQNTPWYKYAAKKWANAVILIKSPSKSYKVGDTILEKDIESYFVWIPRYRYKVWNTSSADGYQSTFINSTNDVNSIRQLTGQARLIDIIFESKNATISSGEYLTHPAFTAFGVSGLWVSKFEASGTSGAVTIKPNMTSWGNVTIGTFWNAFYNYKRALDSHMMKNTEWGAVAYLSHSAYGIGNQININNNSDCKTGYSAAANTDQSSFTGTSGTKTFSDNEGPAVTQPYNTPTGYLASTTGNITGIYDMSGGTHEYVAGYLEPYGISSSTGVASGLTATDLAKTQYFDKYSGSTLWTSYSKRILGDATGEMGPFYLYLEKNGSNYSHNGWYANGSMFVEPSAPWFARGGSFDFGVLAGQFCFHRDTGRTDTILGSRIVLAFK